MIQSLTLKGAEESFDNNDKINLYADDVIHFDTS